MKYLVPAIIFLFGVFSHLASAEARDELKGTLSISGAWAVYPAVVAWAEEFQKIYPQVRIDVSAGGAGKGAADAIAGLSDIGMVSREPDPAELKQGIIPLAVFKDAVFPIVSTNHYAIDDVLRKGISREFLAAIYIEGRPLKWNDLLQSGKSRPIHLYTRADSCGAAASWARFFDKKQEDLRGVGIFGDPGLLEAVKRDPVGIGYTNFSFLFARDGTVLPGLKILPLDNDGNGKSDANEVINNRDDAIGMISSENYPVTRKNYFYIKPQSGTLTKSFIRFVLSDEGIRIINESKIGVPLSAVERDKILRTMEELK